MAGALASGCTEERAGNAWDDAFALVRRRWRDVTAGSGFDAEAEPYRTRLARLGAAAAGHRDAMAPADASLWPDLPFPSLTETPVRLRTMARAYALEGTGLTGDASLAAAVATGIDHYRRRVYTEGADPVGNWWDWQIGTPRKLLDAAVLIGPHLTNRQSGALRDAVDHFVPECRLNDYSGTSTGANRVDLCTVMLLRAILRSDPDKAALAVSALSPVFPYVHEGDGFYRDGSFIQHTFVPYQGGYGAVTLSGLATLFAVVRGSPWEITDPNRQIVFDMVERSFAPVVHDGFCMDLVSGRGIGREPYGDHRKGRGIASSILLLAEAATAAERDRWQRMVKGWASRNTSVPMLKAAESSDLGFHARLAAVLDDDAIPAAEEPVGHRLMAMSARAVHRRPGWCAGLSMASYRIGHYEHGNGENPRGWHTGSGTLYWWGEGHGDQYSDAFWSTVDPYRLPGTTVSTRRLADGAGEGWGDTCPPGRWVGGATDGMYATVGQHLNGFESTMEAFKSWFFLDDAVICLGAAISGRDGVPVETIVDNRRTDALLTVDDAAGWAHLEGHGGYVLPGGARLKTLCEQRASGSVTRIYATLWLDHGVDPSSAGYVYLLLPGASLAETRTRAADTGWARVLANTARTQGVEVPSLGITAVNFWNEGAVGGLSASAPCAVLVRERGDGTATLAVSDPRRDLSELTVTWDRPVAAVLHGDPLLASAATGATLALTFERLAAHGGGSSTVTVRL
ncbi:polysaccharide lyase 8 family protein [Microtetraspora sp. AC03309]|uniref:polysaccharide lyase 8 family protein n=1 Tax=Microtetraspora sp. AC03309 TaxID=2779376 RepID=UPI001E405A60|nr:polysaccharide lyase 8 family protein [Microtetraspora sp. AC03309]